MKVKTLRGADGVLPEHTKAYGGMTACKTGFDGRVFQQHENPEYRAKTCSLHYTMLELPETENDFYYWATYPRGKDDISYIPEIVVNEGVMIGLNGLFEDVTYYNKLRGLGVPKAMSGVHSPCVGLNRDPGFKYNHFKGDTQHCALFLLHPLEESVTDTNRPGRLAMDSVQSPMAIAEDQLPELPELPVKSTIPSVAGIVKPTKFMVSKENRQRREKLMSLISTGAIVSLSHRDDSGKKFTIYRGMDIRLDKHYMKGQHGAAIRAATDATVFIHLTPEASHPNAFYSYGGRPELSHFGMWIQVDARVGFWIVRKTSQEVRRNPKHERMAADIATIISQDFGLIRKKEGDIKE